MKLKLQARHLWDAIEFPDTAEYDDDRSALDAICSAVPEEMVPALATKDTAYDAWEAIKTFHIGDDCVWRSTAQTLRAEYENITLPSRSSPCVSPTSRSGWQSSVIRSLIIAWWPSTCALLVHGTSSW
jgi:hypothetical protein